MPIVGAIQETFMTRFTLQNAGLSEKSITRDECRVIGRVALLSILLVAVITFAVALRWQVAAITVALAIPGSLVGGVVCVLYDRCPRPEKQSEASQQVSLHRIISNVASGILICIALYYVIPSWSTGLTVAVALVSLQRVYGRRDGMP